MREALAHAEQQGAWLAAGPIRPGIRRPYSDDVFAVGNLAGEAHPIIAEGIGMAIQSSRLLAAELIARRSTLATEDGRARAGGAYSIAWRRCFATRIRMSAFLAGLAMRPRASILLPLLERFPEILTMGAGLSGKTMFPSAFPPASDLEEAAPKSC
jgi:flavin-dependent dehydrogenase